MLNDFSLNKVFRLIVYGAVGGGCFLPIGKGLLRWITNTPLPEKKQTANQKILAQRNVMK
jgi:hypothetical protein